MNKKTKTAVLGLASVCLVGCAPKASINANTVAQPMRDVAARHDAYVNSDTSLSDLERSIYLRDTEILNTIIDEATSTDPE